jgi:hypothetical protein
MYAPVDYLAFLPMREPGGHRVVAIVDGEDGEVLEAIATFSDPVSAIALADALTGAVLRQDTAKRRIDAVVQRASTDVRATVDAILTASGNGRAGTRTILAAALRRPVMAGFNHFPTRGCPPSCEVCAALCLNECHECGTCGEGRCATCTTPVITPRTAKVMHHCATLLADEVFDEADTRRLAHEVSQSAALPPVARAQGPAFYRRMARAYDDIASDLVTGRRPQPSCIAENIALTTTVDMASEVCDEFINDGLIAMDDVATSAHDFTWGTLRDVLVQDEDHEVYLYSADPAPPGSLDHWFDEVVERSRDPARGFRR